MQQTIYSGLKTNVRINFAWLKQLADPSLKKTSTSYEKVPLVYRAMNIRADNLVRVPFYFFQGEREVDEYPFEDSLPFRDLLKQTEMALMANGKSTILILEKELEKEYAGVRLVGAGLQWLNPFTVRVKAVDDQETGMHKLLFDQHVNGRHYPLRKDYWTEDEMYYIHEFGFDDDIGAGICPAAVALADANTIHFLSSFLAKFFEGGAIAPTIVSVKEGTGALPKKEITKWFKEKLKGLIERILVIESGAVEVNQLTAELESFDIDKIDSHVVMGIANAFGMSPTSLVAGSANRATAEFEDLHLMRTTEARARFHEASLNRLLRRFGYRVEARIQELPEFQEDEEQRSTALTNLVNAGEDLLRAYEILGYDLSDEHRKELEEKHKVKMERALNPPTPPPQPPQLPPAQPGNGQLKMELRRWLKKALQRFDEGKSAAVQFASDVIPDEEQKRIILALSNVKSIEEIKTIFDNRKESGV